VEQTVANLLGLYAGLVALNVLISGVMWWSSRAPLQRDLLVVWSAMGGAFAVQGVTGGLFPTHSLIIVLGFSSLWFAQLAFSRLLSDLFQVAVPYRVSAAMMVGALGLSAVAWAAGSHFTIVALPAAIGVAFPLVVTTWRVLAGHWRTQTLSGRALTLSCAAICLHVLDFPFLRHLDEFAAMGFTIAILVVFALSIFAPAVVLEVLVASQARVSAEMEVAHRIQMKVLPPKPAIPGFELACHMKPAEEVGGDYYDVYTLGDQSWILLGDVTGHGLSSGLVMLMAQSILASILHTRQGISPAELNFLANQVLHQNLARLGELRSMTIVALCRTGDGHRFRYSGNHEHLFVYRAATGSVEEVQVDQLPHDLGFLNEFPQSDYDEGCFEVEPGDLIFLATDGVVEASRGGRYEDGMFERERVMKLLQEEASSPLSQIRERVLSELETFTGGVYHDDVTFLLARPVPA